MPLGVGAGAAEEGRRLGGGPRVGSWPPPCDECVARGDGGCEHRTLPDPSPDPSSGPSPLTFGPASVRSAAATPLTNPFIDPHGHGAPPQPPSPPPYSTWAAGSWPHAFFAGPPGDTSFAAGVEVTIQLMLQAPQFLYRIELHEPGGTPGELAPLGGYQVASRLSYFLWSSMPDPALFTAAANNTLATPAQVETIASGNSTAEVMRLARVNWPSAR